MKPFHRRSYLTVIATLCFALPTLGQDIYTTGTPFNLYFTPFAIHVGDFNRDGFMDVVTSGKNDLDGSGIISVLYGKGDGTFKNKIDLASEKFAVDIQVGDLDNDGMPDIVTANGPAQTVSVFMNQKSGGFKAKDPIKIKGEPSLINLGDYDKDGKIDIAIVIKATKELHIYKGTSYKLSAVKILDDVPSAIRSDDYSGNGFSHMVISYEAASYVTLANMVELKGYKYEINTAKIDMLALPQFTHHADGNNDGFEDAFLFDRNKSTIAVIKAEANGLILDNIFTLKVPAGSTSFCVGDFNKDKKADIALLDSANAQVTIYMNQQSDPAPQNTFAQGKLIIVYAPDFTKPNNADVLMSSAYKKVSMYLYYPDGKPARKYFDIESDLSDGQFTIEWAGTDENDAELPNGEYYFYYQLGSLIITRGLKK